MSVNIDCVCTYFYIFKHYIVERDSRPRGPLIRVGGSGREEGRWNKFFFSPVSAGEEGERAAPSCQTISARGSGSLSMMFKSLT